MFRFKRKVLVVGGAGFIGKYLPITKNFFEQWESLDLKTGQDFLEWARLLPKYDVVVFLAVDMGQTEEAYHYNQRLYQALDEYVRRFPEVQVVYTSSAAVYPDSKEIHSELEPPVPVGWYGKSKLLGETHVAQYRDHTILRLSNVYSNGDGNGVIDRFKRGERTIYGTGETIRDFVPVELVATAISSAIDCDWHGIINICTGRGKSINQIWQTFGKGKSIKSKKRPGDVKSSILDNSKFLGLLGFKDEDED